uniref:Uncharacterized protein n=1 Tax=Octopus bimaculoides TaxID=37653 RepID=A0A0L8IBT9_OCTBM
MNSKILFFCLLVAVAQVYSIEYKEKCFGMCLACYQVSSRYCPMDIRRPESVEGCIKFCDPEARNIISGIEKCKTAANKIDCVDAIIH